jgi:hypothetical protein
LKIGVHSCVGLIERVKNRYLELTIWSPDVKLVAIKIIDQARKLEGPISQTGGSGFG